MRAMKGINSGIQLLEKCALYFLSLILSHGEMTNKRVCVLLTSRTPDCVVSCLTAVVVVTQEHGD